MSKIRKKKKVYFHLYLSRSILNESATTFPSKTEVAGHLSLFHIPKPQIVAPNRSSGQLASAMDSNWKKQRHGETATRSYWRWSKKDFYPEPSFENLASYRNAFSHTWHRLKDRVLDRSSEEREVVELRRESENNMKRCLSWWDLIWLCFGSVVGSGIFVVTGLEARDHAGPAILLSYAISGDPSPTSLNLLH